VVHRLALNDTRLFLHQEEKTEVNTAIMILVDRSGSMQHQKIEVASKTAYVVAEALDSIPGCFAAVAAFPVGNSDGVAPLVRFGERPCSSKFGMSAGGGTPLAQALYWAGVELLKREEPRKILLSVTDGEPDDLRTTKRAIRWLLEQGIEPMGLGICEESVRTLFPTNGVVYSVEELPPALFGMLQEKLTR
jgi:cobalamin biosynthesis protein CobT